MRSKWWLLLIFYFLPITITAQKIQSPNVIFILADDLGYGDLGSYGQKLIQTPNLDHMAKEGMRFTQMYAGSTVCAPSRAVLMTGKHMGHVSVRGNAGGANMSIQTLRKGERTIAHVFKDAGYTTALFGTAMFVVHSVPLKIPFSEYVTEATPGRRWNRLVRSRSSSPRRASR